MTPRVILGFAAATLVATLARRRGLLGFSGAVAAIVAGTLAVAAGVQWGVLLVAYFVAASMLSRFRQTQKALRTGSVVGKHGARDAWQVLANGGVFVIAAISAAAFESEGAIAAALGALAASMADTSATEIGTAVGGEPRSIITGQKVAIGMSGGVTIAGTLAMVGGSLFIMTITYTLGFGSRAAWAALAGGIAGALADSLLGATVQERRRCPACGVLTERRGHDCAAVAVTTEVVGGVGGFDNDWVNLTSTAIGALVAAVLSRGGV
jgi:uncharacterized protein (TIGR00297 family)